MASYKDSRIDARKRVFELILEHSLHVGDFRLSSGNQSKFYFDMKKTMLHPEGSYLLAKLVLDRLSDMKVDAIGGLEIGAIPLIGPLTAESFRIDRPIGGFIVRKASKDHGTRQPIEGANLMGKDVVVIDDVTTTGKSALEAVYEARKVGANVRLVLSIVDRKAGAVQLFEEAGVPFTSLFDADELLMAKGHPELAS